MTNQTRPADPIPWDLVRHVAATTGLPEATAARVVADVTAYFGETVEEFVRRRHEELRRAQSELAQAHDLFQDLYDFAPVGYLTFDAHGTILEVNLTAAKMLECRWLKPQLVGQFEFVEWTSDGHLRHKFVGLREDKKAKDVWRE